MTDSEPEGRADNSPQISRIRYPVQVQYRLGGPFIEFTEGRFAPAADYHDPLGRLLCGEFLHYTAGTRVYRHTISDYINNPFQVVLFGNNLPYRVLHRLNCSFKGVESFRNERSFPFPDSFPVKTANPSSMSRRYWRNSHVTFFLCNPAYPFRTISRRAASLPGTLRADCVSLRMRRNQSERASASPLFLAIRVSFVK